MENKNLETLAKQTPKNCMHCSEPLPKEHFVSTYGGHYCNKESCYDSGFTED